MHKQQSLHQKGEIEFRKKLYMQQVEDKKIFDDELDAVSMETTLEDRMKKTFGQMSSFQERNVILSPYIEIGAERCQRSLVMENDLGLSGAAVDISFDMLKSCDHYQRVFSKVRSPIRICCDANTLPFMSNSIPFVFCYETLHHFPEPAPIVKEAHRVLMPGGYFFFDEEPYKRILHIDLYEGEKIWPARPLTRSKMRRAFDFFFRKRSCNEVGHGIIENDDISIGQWKQALMPFEERDVALSYHSIQAKLFNPDSYLKYIAACLTGGNISGICRKLVGGINRVRSIYDSLICPSCREMNSEILLNQKDSVLFCPNCSKRFPIIDGVLFLFTYDKLAELYPHIFSVLQKEDE